VNIFRKEPYDKHEYSYNSTNADSPQVSNFFALDRECASISNPDPVLDDCSGDRRRLNECIVLFAIIKILPYQLGFNIQIDMLDDAGEREGTLVVSNGRCGILADIERIFERERHFNRFGQSACRHGLIVHE
jgi:hypothetical protein